MHIFVNAKKKSSRFSSSRSNLCFQIPFGPANLVHVQWIDDLLFSDPNFLFSLDLGKSMFLVYFVAMLFMVRSKKIVPTQMHSVLGQMHKKKFILN